MIPIRQKSPRNEQSGFALVEVLAASAIAAGLVASVAIAVSVAIKTERRTMTVSQGLAEGNIIASRLQAGMPREQIVEGFPGWHLDAEILQQGEIVPDRPDSVMPIQVTLTHRTEPSVGFTTVILAERNLADDEN